MDYARVARLVTADYRLPLDGYHGVGHWARVWENGLRLAEATGANVKVVKLFALFHDSKRFNEHTDKWHGPRASGFVHTVQAPWLELSEREHRLLELACYHHTRRTPYPDITIQTCCDADKLDLGRCGIQLFPEYFFTNAAKQPEMIKWGQTRGEQRAMPGFVKSEWGLDLR